MRDLTRNVVVSQMNRRGYVVVTLSEKPGKASCIVENWMTLTSLNVENIALNYKKKT